MKNILSSSAANYVTYAVMIVVAFFQGLGIVVDDATKDGVLGFLTARTAANTAVMVAFALNTTYQLILTGGSFGARVLTALRSRNFLLQTTAAAAALLSFWRFPVTAEQGTAIYAALENRDWFGAIVIFVPSLLGFVSKYLKPKTTDLLK